MVKNVSDRSLEANIRVIELFRRDGVRYKKSTDLGPQNKFLFFWKNFILQYNVTINHDSPSKELVECIELSTRGFY